ncbi:MAG: tetratricopeptide repeat protein [Pseudomonadota bacterium]
MTGDTVVSTQGNREGAGARRNARRPALNGVLEFPALAIVIAMVFALVLVLSVTPAYANDAVLARAEALLNENQPQAALELLTPLEAELSTDLRFDYLYGLALLETGSPGPAVFALERAVATTPSYIAARMELARAYYAMGLLQDAQREFVGLLAQSPPPAAKTAINQYLDDIEARTRSLALKKDLRLRLGSGYDSNANSATDIADFLGFALTEESREVESAFVEVGASGRLTKPVGEGLVLDGALSLDHRFNDEASFVDSTLIQGSGGVRASGDRAAWNVNASLYRLDIDGSLNSQGGALTGAWAYAVRPAMELGVFGRVGALRFGDALEGVDQWQVGATFATAFGGRNQGAVLITAFSGKDDATQTGSLYSRDIYGVRGTATWNLSDSKRLRLSLGLIESRYDGVFFEQEFSDEREDTATQATGAFDWFITEDWLATFLVAYLNNSTDVEVYDFERIQAVVTVQRLWR